MSDKALKMMGDIVYIIVLTLHYGILFHLASMESYIGAAVIFALTLILVTSRDKYIKKITTLENEITALES